MEGIWSYHNSLLGKDREEKTKQKIRKRRRKGWGGVGNQERKIKETEWKKRDTLENKKGRRNKEQRNNQDITRHKTQSLTIALQRISLQSNKKNISNSTIIKDQG